MNNKKFVFSEIIPEFDSKFINLEDINQLNLILNDDDCSDNFYADVCQLLINKGISFFHENNAANNKVIINLDQQYNSGPGVILFAPCDNAREGNSDSLVLALNSAFLNSDIIVSKILCGKSGYHEDNNGNIINHIPTDLENSINNNLDISFTTVSLGTDNFNAEIIANCIIEGLARYCHYLKYYDNHFDLIYNASSNEDTDMVADYFATTSSTLLSYNNMDSSIPIDSYAIINPHVKEIKSFILN